MENNRMLSSRFFKKQVNRLFKTYLPIILGCYLFGVTAASAKTSFLNSDLFIGSNEGYTLQIQSRLTETGAIAFQNSSLKTIATELSTTLEIPIYVDSTLSETQITYFTSRSTYGEILDQISTRAKAFLVYRDNYLQISPQTQLNLQFSTELTRTQLQKLADIFYKTESVFKIGRTKASLHTSRQVLIDFREFLVTEQLQVEVLSTDMVVNGFTVI